MGVTFDGGLNRNAEKNTGAKLVGTDRIWHLAGLTSITQPTDYLIGAVYKIDIYYDNQTKNTEGWLNTK